MDHLQFQVFSIPIAIYQHHPPLVALVDEAERIKLLFNELGGIPANSAKAESYIGQSTAVELLGSWIGRDEPSGVLIWLGHGASDGDNAWLACSDTPDPINGNGLVPEAIADQINNDWRRRMHDDTAWAMVVVEACGAGTFISRIISVVTKYNPHRLALVGVGGDGTAFLGRFGDALRDVVDSYTVNDESVRLRDFLSRLDDFLFPDGVVFQFQIGNQVVLPRHRILDAQVSAPIDIHDALVAYLTTLTPDERSHFIPKAQGAEHGELAWYFVGRDAERRTVSRWLRENSAGMLVVTGRAGVGKSALLGNLRVYSDPGLRRLLIDGGHLIDVPTADRPPDNVFDAVVHLTGVTTGDLVRKLADAAGAELPTGEGTESGADLDALMEWLRNRRFTILADALDEAQEPATIASTVLRRLAALPRTRIIVGTRASTKEGPDQPYTSDQDILDALGRPTATIMYVDRDPDSVSAYVKRRLAAFPDRVERDLTNTKVEEIAAMIAATEREFLFARLAVHELIARPELTSEAHRDELENLLDGDHRALFAAAVQRLSADSPAVRALLEALAIARGRGVPRADRLWSVIASAIADDLLIRESDIETLLTRAAPYIMLDAENGQSVYRLAHRTFQEFFNSPGVSENGLPCGSQERHQRVARALMACALDAGTVNQYVTHRLAEHVAEGELWHELAAASAALDQLAPDSVAAEALRTAYGRADLPSEIAASLAARQVLSMIGPENRALTRTITMACLRPPAAPTPNDARRARSPAWAQLRRTDPLHVTLPGHDAAVRAATSLQLPDGRVLLATGGEDTTVRLWDLHTGRPVGNPLAGGRTAVLGVATLRLNDGVTLVVGTTYDGYVRLWNAESGQPYAGPIAGHAGAILGVVSTSTLGHGEILVTCGIDRKLIRWQIAVGRPIIRSVLATNYRASALAILQQGSERSVLLTGGFDSSVRLWDPLTGDAVGSPLTGPVGPIRSVTALKLASGQDLVLAGDSEGQVWRWDALTGQLAGDPLTGSPGPVHSLAAMTLPGGLRLVAAGGTDGAIRIWDPEGRLPVGEPMTGHRRPVHSLATVTLPDGRVLLASGSFDGTIRLWDPTLKQMAPRPIARRIGRVTALNVATSGGRAVVATGDDDGLIQFWDAATGDPTGSVIRGDTPAIHALASAARSDGTAILVSGGADGSITRWNLQTRTRIDDPLIGHTGPVTAMATVEINQTESLIASAGNDDKIRIWNPVTGELVGQLTGTHNRLVNALTAMRPSGGPSLLASAADDGSVQLWSVRPNTRRASFHAPQIHSFSALAFLSSHEQTWLAAGGSNGTLVIWDTRQLRQTARSINIGVPILAISALTLLDGSDLLAVSTRDRTIRLIDPADLRLRTTIHLPLDLRANSLTAAGTCLIFCADNGIVMCDVGDLSRK